MNEWTACVRAVNTVSLFDARSSGNPIKLMSPETRVSALHFCCWQCMRTVLWSRSVNKLLSTVWWRMYSSSPVVRVMSSHPWYGGCLGERSFSNPEISLTSLHPLQRTITAANYDAFRSTFGHQGSQSTTTSVLPSRGTTAPRVIRYERCPVAAYICPSVRLSVCLSLCLFACLPAMLHVCLWSVAVVEAAATTEPGRGRGEGLGVDLKKRCCCCCCC